MEKTKILVVEDENIVAKDIQNRLESLGYEVPAVVATGEAALQAVTGQTFGLVLMDIMLKGDLDGVETADRIRTAHNLPIVYLTAYADQTTLDRAKITEPYGYILKPFEERELHITIEMALYKHQMETRLKESEQWFSTTLTCIGDAVVATDTESVITFINTVAEDLTGWRATEAGGHKLDDVFRLVDPAEQKQLARNIARLFRQPGSTAEEAVARLESRTGRHIPIDHKVAPIMDENGVMNGLVLSFRDITERQQNEQKIRTMNQELMRANEELKTLDKLKNNLLSNVSHELRTPLVAVRGYTEMIAGGFSGPVSELQKSQLQISLRSIDRLVLLIDSLVDFSKLELGRAQLETDEIDLGELALEAIDLIRPKAQERELAVTHEIADPQMLISADRNKLYQVFINLLENAVKFNKHGGSIHVSISQPADDRVSVTISDSGVGIPADKLDKVFDRFYQIDSSSTRKFGGMGIGLSLCKDIVEFHGGSISVAGNPEGGAAFTFILPLHPDRLPRHDSASADTAQQRVLLYQSSGELPENLDRLLTEARITVTRAVAEKEARREIETGPLHGIFVPAGDDLDAMTAACRLIRSLTAPARPPVFFIGPRRRGIKEKALAAGAADYLPLPLNEKTFAGKVVKQLSLG